MAEQLHIRIKDIIGIMDDGCGNYWPGFTSLEFEALLSQQPEAEEIILHIDSPGGDVMEGWRICNRLDELKAEGKTITTINEGECYSIATAIALKATEGRVQAYKNSLWMIHKPLFEQLNWVNSDDLAAAAKDLKSIEAVMIADYATATGRTPEEIEVLLVEERFMNAEEAKAYGFIDEVIDRSPVKQTATPAEAKAVAFYSPLKTLPINKTENEMTEEIENSIVTKVINGLKGLIVKNEAPAEETPAVVAASVTLADGPPLYFTGELAEGTAVFVDEAMTEPATDGTYELEDGRSITITDGAITAIMDAPDETVQALAEKDAEISNLKAELESLKGVSAKVSEHEATISNLKTELEKVKNFVPGGGDNSPKPKQTYANYDQEKQKANPFNSAAEKLKSNLKK